LGLDAGAVEGFFYSSKSQGVLMRESAPPHGCLLLVTLADAAAGCGAFRRLDARSCELLHVYVRKEWRGRGIARRVIEQLIETAADAGYEAMRLETATFMTEALKLYTSIGFAERNPYREIPSGFLPFTVCMELQLARH
jgi:GNAT superfamily N-acetyltransferase